MNRLLVLCATAFVIVGCGRAVSPTPVSDPPPENAGTFALTGSVWDASDAGQASLAGVRIDASDGFGHREAFTDGAGHYSVEALGPGTWTVNVTKPGYLPQIIHLDLSGDTSVNFQLERAEPSPRARPEGKLTRD
jgi:hypothetical protein